MGADSGYRGRTPAWHPDLDVDEDSNGWYVEVRLPGVAPEEVTIDVTDRELTIRSTNDDADAGDGGTAGDSAAAGTDGGAATEQLQPASRPARRIADFFYRLTIPADVDAEAIDATMDHGLLTIRLPRSTKSNTRRISVGGRAAAGGSSVDGQVVIDNGTTSG